MFELTPKGLFSQSFEVADPSGPLVDIQQDWWRERATLVVQGVSYSVYRESFVGPFVLEYNGQILAYAHKAISRVFTIDYAETSFTLKGRPLQRAFDLLVGEQAIGSLEPGGIFSRKMIVNLSPDLPLFVQVFMAWLVLIIWRRASNASNAGGAG